MESDAQFRQRIYAKLGWSTTFVPGEISNCEVASGEWLDHMAAKVGLTRIGASPDLFGASLTEALRREDAIIPHSVTRVETQTEKDDLWRSIVEYGRGG